ncbi:membrane bound hydrogenase, NiFe-hydrogenase small subunit [Roseibium sp. TrichSKD4]|nr:membrane bound hydrogenase, NiFe-hydrogenase small subunit [Roseibium sp. TrichSKD4]
MSYDMRRIKISLVSNPFSKFKTSKVIPPSVRRRPCAPRPEIQP